MDKNLFPTYSCELLFSNALSYSMWNSTEGYTETATGIINGWILHCLLICLQIPLNNTRSQTQYNRTMKVREILQIASHLLQVTLLLKYIIGTTNQMIQSVPSDYFTAHWLWWQSFKKIDHVFLSNHSFS